MSQCRYTAFGEYECGKSSCTFEMFDEGSKTQKQHPKCNPGKQKLKLPYEGRPNCKDACSYYAYMNSCPMMTGNVSKTSGTCACPLDKTHNKQ